MSEQRDNGTVLCKLQRGEKAFGMKLKTFEGKPYVELAMVAGNGFVEKTLSVRIREIPQVLEALQKASELAYASQPTE